MRRRLEDAAEVNCDACSESCANWGRNDNNIANKSNYVECQAGFEDDDGLQLYYSPQCSDKGQIVVVLFYGNECIIKTKYDLLDFD